MWTKSSKRSAIVKPLLKHYTSCFRQIKIRTLAVRRFLADLAVLEFCQKRRQMPHDDVVKVSGSLAFGHARSTLNA